MERRAKARGRGGRGAYEQLIIKTAGCAPVQCSRVHAEVACRAVGAIPYGDPPASPWSPLLRYVTAPPLPCSQLYEQRVVELEHRREVSGKRLRQLWEQEASEKKERQIQVGVGRGWGCGWGHSPWAAGSARAYLKQRSARSRWGGGALPFHFLGQLGGPAGKRDGAPQSQAERCAVRHRMLAAPQRASRDTWTPPACRPGLHAS